MSIATTNNKVTYQGNGATTVWPFSFTVLEKAHLQVILTSAAGAETTLTSDYTVDLDTKRVTYPGYVAGQQPPAAQQPPVLPTGSYITLLRVVPYTQETDLGDRWPFSEIENMSDRTTMQVQQLAEELARTVKVPIVHDVTPDQLLASIEQSEANAAASATAAQTAQTGAETAEANAAASATAAQTAQTGAETAEAAAAATAAELAGLFDGTGTAKTADLITKGPWVDVRAFGAKGDGVTDDTAAINAACNYIVSNAKPKILCIPPGTYKISGTVTFDIAYMSVAANCVTFDASGLNDVAVLVTSTANSFTRNFLGEINGILVKDNNARGNTVAWFIDGPAASSIAGPYFGSMRHCGAYICNTGLKLGDSAFNFHFYNCNFAYCLKTIHKPREYYNASDVNFYSCKFSGTSVGAGGSGSDAYIIYNEAQNTEMYFHSCEFEYFDKLLYSTVGNSHFQTYGCRIETIEPADYLPIITLSNNAATFSMHGGCFLVKDSSGGYTLTSEYLIDCNNTGNGGVRFNGVFMSYGTSTSRLATGTGQVVVTNPRRFSNSYFRFTHNNNNLLSDGGFEGESISDLWFISRSGTTTSQALTDRLVATAGTIAKSTTSYRRGAKSLFINKTSASEMMRVNIIVPCTPGKDPIAEFYLKKPGTGMGTIIISRGYGLYLFNSSGVPYALKTKNIADSIQTFTADPVDWMQKLLTSSAVVDTNTNQLAPPWANYFYLQIELPTTFTGELYLDDVAIEMR